MSKDDLYRLLDYNNSIANQQKGIAEAMEYYTLHYFLHPSKSLCGFSNNKDVWKNCAIVVSAQTDEKLEIYLLELFDWLKNMNDPGAEIIMERLKKYKRNSIFLLALGLRLNKAKKLEDKMWEENLEKLFCL